MAFRVLNIRYCPVTDTFPDDRAVITRRLFEPPSAEDLTIFHKDLSRSCHTESLLVSIRQRAGMVQEGCGLVDDDCDLLTLSRFISTEPLGIRRCKDSDQHGSANKHIPL